eukprot:GILK01012443.1.p1 GENE.GILK01012443.1~~GILK01012443.1.p1  ORF type:complete len:204 (-),score=31.55 GILK01012443.1:40-651(-)
MTSMFASTTRFREAVALVNAVPVEKLPLVITRIVRRLHLKEQIFKDEEAEQLQDVLQLSAAEVDTVVHGCSYIFEQAAYRRANQKVLAENLQAAGLGDVQAQAFYRIWGTEGASYLEKLKEKPLGTPMLTDVNWRLHLEMAQDDIYHQKEPVAIFNFGLDNSDSTKQSVQNENSSIAVEMDSQELYSFFLKLETIQQQLDRLQ